MNSKDLICFFDLETSGKDPKTCNIIESAWAVYSLKTRRKIASHSIVVRPKENVDEFIEKYGLLGVKTKGRLNSEFSDLRKMGVLLKTADGYQANVDVNEFVAKSDPLVQPRTPREFKEISSKHLLPKISPRGQELRSMQFINLGASIVEPNRF